MIAQWTGNEDGGGKYRNLEDVPNIRIRSVSGEIRMARYK
jgi:hypothetical protein